MINESVEDLASGLVSSGAIPRKAAQDAAHIAIAAVHSIDYLLTWNCRHIANAELIPIVSKVCTSYGYACPIYSIIGHNCILPRYRNKGIGKHQITFALNKFQKYGFQNTRVSTKRDHFFKNARKMYESCGFVECVPYRNDGENMIYYSIKMKNH